LKKNDAISVIIYAVKNVTSAGWGCGGTKKYYTPSVRMGFDNRNLKGYSIYYYDKFKIFLSNNIKVDDDDIIIVDIVKILFVQNLIIKGLDIKMI
jgi:hypothetical protein